MQTLLRRQTPALLVALGALLFAAYGTTLTRGPFGVNDDYQFLRRVYEGAFDPSHNEIAGMGRPLAAWIYEGAYGLCAGKVSRLVWLRAATMVGIGIYGWMLGRALQSLGYPAMYRWLVPALAVLSPACGVMAAWIAAGFAVVALVAALGAGMLLVRPRGLWVDFLAGMLLAGACATWQAAAPLALFPVILRAWRADLKLGLEQGWWRPWVRVFVVCGLALTVYFAGFVFYARTVQVPATGVARMAFSFDIPGKLRLLGLLLRDAAAWWTRFQPGAWEWTVGALVTSGCVAGMMAIEGGRVNWRRSWQKIVLAAAILFASVAPLLLAREDNGAFRSLVALYTAVAFLLAAGVENLGRVLSRFGRAAIEVGIVMTMAAAARYHVWHGLVEPNAREYVGVRDEVRRQFPGGPPPRLVYLAPPYVLLVEGRLTPSWEYGLVSSTFWWVTDSFLADVFMEAGSGGSVRFPTVVAHLEAGNKGVPVLQTMPALLREAGEWGDDLHWGRVRKFRDGWVYSPWFGYFRATYYPLVLDHLLGTLWVTNEAAAGQAIWFYHEGFGHFSTSAGEYPHVRVGGSDRRLRVEDGDPLQIGLRDEVNGERVGYQP